MTTTGLVDTVMTAHFISYVPKPDNVENYDEWFLNNYAEHSEGLKHYFPKPKIISYIVELTNPLLYSDYPFLYNPLVDAEPTPGTLKVKWRMIFRYSAETSRHFDNVMRYLRNKVCYKEMYCSYEGVEEQLFIR